MDNILDKFEALIAKVDKIGTNNDQEIDSMILLERSLKSNESDEEIYQNRFELYKTRFVTSESDAQYLLEGFKNEELNFSKIYSQGNLKFKKWPGVKISQRAAAYHNFIENLNQKRETTSTQNFYFPEIKNRLNQLHDELLRAEFIQPNDDFSKSFEKKIKPLSIKSTIWRTGDTKLYYLLYILNNKKEFLEGMSIDKIAHQLFQFEEVKIPKNMRSNFSKAFTKFEDPAYLKKKMSDVTHIILSAGIITKGG